MYRALCVVFYYICSTRAQYILKISVLKTRISALRNWYF